ncbi:primosomal replication protein N [Pelomicrobium methylotrophicum]|uniref:primosomal replication protein N n=1 Tax=Pelomicrobium methylotrophicum TaxID=2602750 RepID=UPI001969E294|nr:primosomal replication protein N [Pelomicrobium methylotrophicum]
MLLSGRTAALSPLRRTPAGIPVLDFRIRHGSEQMEAGHVRRVEGEVEAVCVGPLAETIAAAGQGSGARFGGFLANRRQGSSQVVLHVTEFELLKD